MNWLFGRFFPFLGGAFFCGLVYIPLGLLYERTSYVHGFFFRFWPIQVFSTFLFGVAVSYFMVRYFQYKAEKRILQKVEIPSGITYDDANDILEDIPEVLHGTICFRRLREILKGYVLQEDVIQLNQQLSRRDMDQITMGHSLLINIRNIVPVIGFLGTVIGLSLGMMKFPELVTHSAKIEELKFVLRDFAASLSIAFDTTLLALVYTVVIIIISGLLMEREGLFVQMIDEIADELIAQLKGRVHPTDAGGSNSLSSMQLASALDLKREFQETMRTASGVFLAEFKTYIETLKADMDSRNRVLEAETTIAFKDISEVLIEIRDAIKKMSRNT